MIRNAESNSSENPATINGYETTRAELNSLATTLNSQYPEFPLLIPNAQAPFNTDYEANAVFNSLNQIVRRNTLFACDEFQSFLA